MCCHEQNANLPLHISPTCKSVQLFLPYMNTSSTDDTLQLPKKVLDCQPPVELYLANKLSVFI